VTVVIGGDFVLALARRRDPHHDAAGAWLETTDEDLVTSPLVLADADERIAEHLGAEARDALWGDLERGAYTIRWWADALDETLAVAHRHPDLGLTRASLVALAGRLNTTRIATFDERYRYVTTPGGEAFVVLPADA
jgi:predicted nucleic acid-binding protein